MAMFALRMKLRIVLSTVLRALRISLSRRAIIGCHFKGQLTDFGRHYDFLAIKRDLKALLTRFDKVARSNSLTGSPKGGGHSGSAPARIDVR